MPGGCLSLDGAIAPGLASGFTDLRLGGFMGSEGLFFFFFFRLGLSFVEGLRAGSVLLQASSAETSLNPKP